MRRTAAVLALGVMLPTAALAAPTKLTDAQLDLVSAGVSATIEATAAALGSTALTNTDAITRSRDGRIVSIAWGRGSAFAKGTDAADSNVNASGEGDRVIARSNTVSYRTPTGIVSRSWGFVFAIEINRDAIAARRKR